MFTIQKVEENSRLVCGTCVKGDTAVPIEHWAFQRENVSRSILLLSKASCAVYLPREYCALMGLSCADLWGPHRLASGLSDSLHAQALFPQREHTCQETLCQQRSDFNCAICLTNSFSLNTEIQFLHHQGIPFANLTWLRAMIWFVYIWSATWVLSEHFSHGCFWQESHSSGKNCRLPLLSSTIAMQGIWTMSKHHSFSLSRRQPIAWLNICFLLGLMLWPMTLLLKRLSKGEPASNPVTESLAELLSTYMAGLCTSPPLRWSVPAALSWLM